jgi:hypothetical protein
MLVLCPRSLDIWRDALRRFEQHEQVQLGWSPENLIFGFVFPLYTSDVQIRLNTIVLLLKFYIYSERRKESFHMSVIGFNSVLKRYLLQQWHVAQATGKLADFERIWNEYL